LDGVGMAAGKAAPARRLQPLRGLVPFVIPYRRRIAVALLFLTLSAAATLVLPLSVRMLVDHGMDAPAGADVGARLVAVRGYFVLLFLVAVALAIFTAARFYTVTWIGERVTTDLRQAVYAHVLRQSPQFFEHVKTGEVLSRLTTDTTVIQNAVGSSISLGLRSTVLFAGGLVLLVATSPHLMFTVLGVIVLVVVPALVIGRRVRRLSRASQDRLADTSGIAAEVLNAIPVVQSFTQEGAEATRFKAANERTFATSIRRTRTRALLTAFVITGVFGSLLYGLHTGVEEVLAGRSSAGELSQTALYVMLVASSVAVLAEVWGDLLRAAGATERLMELLSTEPLIADPPQPIELPLHPHAGPAGAQPQGVQPMPTPHSGAGVAPGPGADEVPGFRRGLDVRFDQVCFSYPSRPERQVLDHLDMAVGSGEAVALVGLSGAGKSTIFQLLQRFYDIDQGALLIDGIDIRRVGLAALRSRIAVVPQEPVIFSGTVLDNIRYGRPGATDAEAFAAARAAHVDEFVNPLAQRYATFVGERGLRLSGGQRQRIAIARAIVKDAPLLLLDEATSSLDAESERAVQAALDEAMKGRTTIVIAHRLATVQRADAINVLDQGVIVESGTHAELIAGSGLYARLAHLQFVS
jgi:ATP-binding cassette subfamily B protein